MTRRPRTFVVALAVFGSFVVGSLCVLAWGDPQRSRYIYIFQAYVYPGSPRGDGLIGDIGGYTGTWRSWHPNGRLRTAENLVNGEPEGRSVVYWDNGNVNLELEFKNGELHGSCRRYNRNGGLVETTTYREGMTLPFLVLP